MLSDIVQIDRSAALPVQAQIAEGFERAIRSGSMKSGQPLPSLRALSRRLGISAATAAAAYRLLVAERLIEARPRSGFIVARGRRGSARVPGEAPAQLSLHRVQPNLRVHPVAAFGNLLAEVAAEDAEAGGYEDYRGSRDLRYALAALDTADGIAVDPETECLVTAGAQQAITVIARTAGAGARIALEEPTYPGARLAFQAAGARLAPIPVGENGPDAAALDRAGSEGLDFFYCCPTYGNPSGRSWDRDARARVVDASARHGFTIIEDDYLGDLDYLEEGLPRLASLSAAVSGSRVIRIRTFSKCLLPALRIAGVSADERAISRLLATKSSDDICGSALLQRALARYLDSGGYASHLRAVRPHYAALRGELRKALSRTGAALRFEDPPAGLCLIGTLEEGTGLDRFVAECRAEGVLVAPGPDYWLDRTRGADKIRIGFGSLESADIPRAVAAMERAATRSKTDFFERALI